MRRNRHDELGSARLKLDDLLTNITRGDVNNEDYYDEDTFQSSLKTKRSRVSRSTRSRKRVREDEYARASKCVLKLFDRGVDLAEFCKKYPNSDPPLYPLCRAWMLNDTVPNDFLKEPDMQEMDIKTFEKDVYLLPGPDPLPLDDDGNEIDLRLPAKMDPQSTESEIDAGINSLADESIEKLYEVNMCRWRDVRNQWREASFKSQSRYNECFRVIDELSSLQQNISVVPVSVLEDDRLTLISNNHLA
ncbi:protein lin-37 homolog [Brevipalpus obovatus]|uniref:protein lin-37 homolog n=1 Tax=Brevipalpus obovatus TaxID=246614 RepID=UPI003D9EF47F